MSRTVAPQEDQRAIATRLCSAVADGDIQTVKSIIEENSVPLDCPSLDGHLPLELAAFWGHMDILSHLIHCGADINATNKRDGSTALHAAAMQNHGPAVKYLLVNCQPPADMTIIDNQGRTPADYASSSDVIWNIFLFSGCKLSRRTKKELEVLGIRKDQPSSLGRSLQLGERNVGARETRENAKADQVAMAYGDVLAGTD